MLPLTTSGFLMRSSLLYTGLVAVCATFVAVLMTRSNRAVSPHREPVPVSDPADNHDSRIYGRVSDPSEHLPSLGTAAAATTTTLDHQTRVEAPPETTTQSLDPQTLEEVIKMLRSIESRLARIETSLEKNVFLGPPPSPAEVRAAPARNWDALNDLARLYDADKEMAVDSVQFLSYREVLQRFGAPTKIEADNSFHYQESRAQSGTAAFVKFAFLNGFVRELNADVKE